MCSERVSIYCSTSDIRYDIFCIDVLQFAVTVHVSFHSLDHTVWPNELGPFGPQDRRFTLPGNVGVGSKIRKPAEKANTDILFENLPEERQMQLFQQVEQTVQQV
jgi:hypothetical protein